MKRKNLSLQWLLCLPPLACALPDWTRNVGAVVVQVRHVHGEIAIATKALAPELMRGVTVVIMSGRRRRKVEYHRLDDKHLDSHAEVEDTASLLYRPPESNPHPNATMVMIRGIDEDVFAYVPPLSWDIAGDDDDQGAGMYWYIDPPLPENLVRSMHAYMGDRCEWDCGDPLISGAMGGGQCLFSAVLPIVMLLVSGMLRMF